VVNRQMFLPALGQNMPPEPWETGFKDMVIAYPGEIARIKAKFDMAGRFVWHCHIVEHEGNEMMRPTPLGPIRTNRIEHLQPRLEKGRPQPFSVFRLMDHLHRFEHQMCIKTFSIHIFGADPRYCVMLFGECRLGVHRPGGRAVSPSTGRGL
jgi:Multicopper oxidase